VGYVSAATAQLVNVATIVVAAAAALYIWEPLLPALAAAEQVELWTSTSVVQGEMVVNRITLATVINVLILVGLTVFAAKRLPAVIEIVLRSRSKVSAGTRYATSALLNYVIVGAGIVAALSALGLKWSQLQWLVAALGVGIGFGLQEIVARQPSPRVLRRRALDVEDGAAGVEPQDVIGERADERPQLAVGLQQLLRAEVERSLQHGAIVVELLVRLIDRREHRLELRRHARLGEVALQLPAQQAVQLGHRQRSDSVVTVMVWLCSSQRAFCVNGEISP